MTRSYGYNSKPYHTTFYGKHKQEDFTESAFTYHADFISKNKAQDLYNISSMNETIIKGRGLFTTSKDYRDSDIFFIKDINSNPLYKQIVDKFMSLNDEIYQADITEIQQLQYTYYYPKQHFNWHPDGPFAITKNNKDIPWPDDLLYRKLTLALCLSKHDEYEGGEFMILDPFTTPDRAVASFKMDAGEAIIFPAFLFHKVAPVISGVRKSIITWGCGPRWK